MNNILIIGNGITDFGREIYKSNTNYYLIEMSKPFPSEILNFIKNHNSIILAKPDLFDKVKIKRFADLCKKYNITPFFISETKEDKTDLIYSNVSLLVEGSHLYFKNDNNEDLELFIDIIKGYLLKGYVKNDKAIPTSEDRG